MVWAWRSRDRKAPRVVNAAGPSPFLAPGGSVVAGAASRNRRRSALGTLELAAIAAVTALMGAVAYSAYRTHNVRAEVAAGLAAAELLKGILIASFERTRDIDALRAPVGALGSPDTAAVVSAISVERGRIDIWFGDHADPALSGRHLSLTPYEAATLELVWLCGDRQPGPGLRPLGFAAGGPQALPLASAIEPRYLPDECR